MRVAFFVTDFPQRFEIFVVNLVVGLLDQALFFLRMGIDLRRFVERAPPFDSRLPAQASVGLA